MSPETPSRWCRLGKQYLEFQGTVCPNCGKPHFPPKQVCPYCGEGKRKVHHDQNKQSLILVAPGILTLST